MTSPEHDSPRYSSGWARRVVLLAGIASFVSSILMFYVSEWLYRDYSISKGASPWAEVMYKGADIGFYLGLILLVLGLALPRKGVLLRGRVNRKRIAPLQPPVVLWFALSISLVVFVFMVGLLFNAGAEAFYGTQEPMFEMLGGLILGGGVAGCVFVLVLYLLRSGAIKLAWAIVIALIAFDVAAIPYARWIIRLASAAPRGVIDLRDLW